MLIPRSSVLLRIFIGESERRGHRPLYEAIVLQARELAPAGRRCSAARWASVIEPVAHGQDPAALG